MKIIVFGKDELSERQKELIRKYLNNELSGIHEIQYIYKLGMVEKEDIENLHPREECYENDMDENCIDFVVLEYDISWVILELLKRGIKVLGFMTARSINGDGDLFDGRVKTIGLVTYEPYYRKITMVVD
ncbi:MAG: hypothetical protein QXY39_03765 [Thermofilaceae archaeon]